MYDDETEASACFDPNNISDSTTATVNTTTNTSSILHGNGNNNIVLLSHENGYSSHEPNSHNQTQELDSSSCLEFQNPNLGNHFSMIPNCNPPIISDHNQPNTNNNNDPNNAWVNNNNGGTHHEMGMGMGMGLGNYTTHFVDENLQPTTDLLTLLHLPRCSSSYAPTSTHSLSFGNNGKPSSSPPSALSFLGELNPAMMVDNPSGSGSSTISYDPTTPVSATAFSYDPMFHLNLPPQPSPLFRDLMFQSLPHHHGFSNGSGMRGNGNIGNVGNGNGNSTTLFGGLDDGEGNVMNGIYQEGDHHNMHGNGVFEFSKGDGKAGKCPKNFVTERQRRQNFNDKYQLLRSLVPNQTKGDRASIVWDAINHINELRRTVGELKLLVEKKRMAKERMKRHKTEPQDSTPTPGGPTNGVASGGDHHSNTTGAVDNAAATAAMKPEPDEDFNGSAAIQLRSSWIQRKCKDTEVDVRIVDDDVTIKLVQRKKINCLLSVSRTLDDLQLDLRHVAGGHVGDYYSYLFNSKICEGSSVYASAIANKLIEVVERQYAAASVAVAPTSSF
nr:hypothetical protein [Suaeda aralocaspica]